MNPTQLQTKLIEILENAPDQSASASEAQGDLDDDGIKLDLVQVRQGLEALVAHGRAHKPRGAPGSPVSYQLLAVGATPPSPSEPPPEAPMARNGGRKPDTDALQRVRNAIRDRGSMRNGDVANLLICSTSRASKLLNTLSAAGEIVYVDPVHKHRGYKLASDGPPAEQPAAVSRETPPPPRATPGRRARVTPRAKGARRGPKPRPAEIRVEIKAQHLRGAFTELRKRLQVIAASAKVKDLKRKLQTLEQLAEIVPAPIARVLAEIRQDLEPA